ncbi:hypothetical protein [Sphingopyxis sp. 550A]
MKVVKYLSGNWERVLFALVGIACLTFGFVFIFDEKITSASAVFAIGFFSFLYSNLARFKRFKGLGFEAELWEDKQREAADLIDRLKNVVAIYSREVVMAQVMRGRWSSGADWKANWLLYDELVGQHDALGQKIDFAPLKRDIDQVFLFDMSHHLGSALQKSVENARSEARKKIETEFGSSVRDNAGHNAHYTQFRKIRFDTKDMYSRRSENLAQDLLDQAAKAKEAFQRDFGIEVHFDDEVLRHLARVSQWFAEQPLSVTDEMIGMAEKESVD